jgi:hypothetical protein
MIKISFFFIDKYKHQNEDMILSFILLFFLSFFHPLVDIMIGFSFFFFLFSLVSTSTHESERLLNPSKSFRNTGNHHWIQMNK